MQTIPKCEFVTIMGHCVSKNDNPVAHYNFNANQPIWVIFDRDILLGEYAIEWG